MRFVYQLVIIIFCSIFLPACASGRMAQQLEGGKAAFQAAEFKSAFRQLLPLAAEGNSDAQYAVGYMYYYGYGVPRDEMSGLFWMTKSAEKGNPAAIKALNMIHHKQATVEDFSAKRTISKDEPAPVVVAPKPPQPVISSGYVLQLSGSYHLADVKNLQARHHLQASTHFWRTDYQNRSWYILTYGHYDSVAAANMALQHVPPAVRELKPWVRPVARMSRL